MIFFSFLVLKTKLNPFEICRIKINVQNKVNNDILRVKERKILSHLSIRSVSKTILTNDNAIKKLKLRIKK